MLLKKYKSTIGRVYKPYGCQRTWYDLQRVAILMAQKAILQFFF